MITQSRLCHTNKLTNYISSLKSFLTVQILNQFTVAFKMKSIHEAFSLAQARFHPGRMNTISKRQEQHKYFDYKMPYQFLNDQMKLK